MIKNTDTQNKHNRSLSVIAHRGVCSIFPQNTQEAIIAGIHSADLTEFDIHLTKDLEIIVFHDRYLSRTTDIAQHIEFTDRLKEELIDDYQKVKSDWWVRDFTVNELKKLRVFQPISYRPQFPVIQYKINTLQQIIVQTLKITRSQIHRRKLKSGLLIQIKEQIAKSFNQRDKIICSKLFELLKKYNLNTEQGCNDNNLKIIVQSFNIPLLGQLTQSNIPLVQLFDKNQQITEEMLVRVRTKNIQGIGVTQKNLCNLAGIPQKRVGQICQKLGYSLFYWTIRDDDLNNLPFSCKNYNQAYVKLIQLGVTGLITQFPDKCKGILQLQTVAYEKENIKGSLTGVRTNKQKMVKMSSCESVDASTEYKN